MCVCVCVCVCVCCIYEILLSFVLRKYDRERTYMDLHTTTVRQSRSIMSVCGGGGVLKNEEEKPPTMG